MLINLRKLPAEGVVRIVRIDDAFFAEHLSGDELTGVERPCDVALTVRPQAGIVMVSGSATIALKAVCVRCLNDFVFERTITFDYALDIAGGDRELAFDEAPDGLSFYDEEAGSLDLDQLAGEQILLALPPVLVCADSCTGVEGYKK